MFGISHVRSLFEPLKKPMIGSTMLGLHTFRMRSRYVESKRSNGFLTTVKKKSSLSSSLLPVAQFRTSRLVRGPILP